MLMCDVLGSSLSQSSYTVINLSGDRDGEYGEYEGPTRLVCSEPTLLARYE